MKIHLDIPVSPEWAESLRRTVAGKTYQRASEFIEGIGASLDAIQGRDVILRSFEVAERPMRGEKKTFVSMQVSETNEEDVVTTYHAWSESLADRLNEIGNDKLPVLAKFSRVATSGGFRVWTVE